MYPFSIKISRNDSPLLQLFILSPVARTYMETSGDFVKEQGRKLVNTAKRNAIFIANGRHLIAAISVCKISRHYD